MSAIENNKIQLKIKKWYCIDEKSYELIISQAEKRFDDLTLESESITNKSIKNSVFLFALIGYFINVISQNSVYNISHIYLFTCSVFIFLNCLCLFKLIFPKEIRFKGISPETLIPDSINDEENKGYDYKIILFSASSIIQDNIDKMKKNNDSRIENYKYSIYLLLINIIILSYSIKYII